MYAVTEHRPGRSPVSHGKWTELADARDECRELIGVRALRKERAASAAGAVEAWSLNDPRKPEEELGMVVITRVR